MDRFEKKLIKFIELIRGPMTVLKPTNDENKWRECSGIGVLNTSIFTMGDCWRLVQILKMAFPKLTINHIRHIKEDYEHYVVVYKDNWFDIRGMLTEEEKNEFTVLHECTTFNKRIDTKQLLSVTDHLIRFNHFKNLLPSEVYQWRFNDVSPNENTQIMRVKYSRNITGLELNVIEDSKEEIEITGE